MPAENSDSDVITITGKKENAEKARDMIQKIQNELANAVEVKVQVPNKLHTHLIGKSGRTIKVCWGSIHSATGQKQEKLTRDPFRPCHSPMTKPMLLCDS